MNAVVTLHRALNDRYHLGNKVNDFFAKLQNNPDSPGLNLEAVHNAADKRVRTARVDKKYRAVLFELQGTRQRHFVFLDIFNHDDAYREAARVKLSQNAVNGVTQLEFADPTDEGTYAGAGAADGEMIPRSEMEERFKQRLAEEKAIWQAEREQDETRAASESESEAEAAAESEADAAHAGEFAAASANTDRAAVTKVDDTEERPADVLAASGISTESLRDEMGLSDATIATLTQAPSLAAAEKRLQGAPAWEEHAATGLMMGLSLDEIRDELGLHKASAAGDADAEENEDDRLVAGLQTAAARMDFVFAAGEDELNDVIKHGSFAEWRVFLHPSQRKAVETDHAGSARVAGGAGTGKTVVVVHRTKYLLQKNPHARVLLTTYTRGLANQLKQQMNEVYPDFPEAAVKGAPGLWISGIDALVHDVLKNAQAAESKDALEEKFGISQAMQPSGLTSREEQKLWEDAVDLVGPGELSAEKSNPGFLKQEYATVILNNDVTSWREYRKVHRKGRGTPLSFKERKSVWKIVQAFHAKCASAGRLTWAANAVLAATILQHRGQEGMFDHVLVDEAQDFHAGHWRFLRAVAAEGPNDISLAEDSHQRIYNQKLVLSHFGISTRGRASTKLKVNYRTTAQNLRYAAAILDGTEWVNSDEEADDLDGYHSVRQGPPPEIIQAVSKEAEAEKVAEYIRGWLDTEEDVDVRVGVLTRTNQRKKELETQLMDMGIPVSTDWRAKDDQPVSVMTMHNAKGLEFTHVVLMGVNEGALPQRYRLIGLPEAEREDARQQEQALLYVAASRARDKLLVSMVGEPSELLPKQD